MVKIESARRRVDPVAKPILQDDVTSDTTPVFLLSLLTEALCASIRKKCEAALPPVSVARKSRIPQKLSAVTVLSPSRFHKERTQLLAMYNASSSQDGGLPLLFLNPTSIRAFF